MALLLQALRDVRTLSGDFDLLPPLTGGDSLGADHLARNLWELAPLVDRHGSSSFVVSRSSFLTGTQRHPAEECR